MVIPLGEASAERTQVPERLDDDVEEAVVLAREVDEALGVGQVHARLVHLRPDEPPEREREMASKRDGGRGRQGGSATHEERERVCGWRRERESNNRERTDRVRRKNHSVTHSRRSGSLKSKAPLSLSLLRALSQYRRQPLPHTHTLLLLLPRSLLPSSAARSFCFLLLLVGCCVISALPLLVARYYSLLLSRSLSRSHNICIGTLDSLVVSRALLFLSRVCV